MKEQTDRSLTHIATTIQFRGVHMMFDRWDAFLRMWTRQWNPARNNSLIASSPVHELER